LFALAPLAAATVIALARPAMLRGWAAIRVRFPVLIWAAAAAHFVLVTDPPWAAAFAGPFGGLWPVVVSWALGVTFVAVNLPGAAPRARPGLVALATGSTLNMLTRAVNGGMPFSLAAARWAGADEPTLRTPHPGHRPMSGDTGLAAFADIIPVPGLRKVMSLGDLFMVVGIVWFLVGALAASRTSSAEVR
jgi:hypothetical protein